MTSSLVEVVSMPLPGTSLYEISAELLDGTRLSLSHFQGRVLLIVNTASKCGFTPQYGALERLYAEYHGRGFEVLGFPANDFKEQEPGTDEEIAQFCTMNYGVTFPMFSKISVKGEGMDPLYAELSAWR